MLTSTISVPETAPGLTPSDLGRLREQVTAADQVLRAEAEGLQGPSVRAEWRLAGPGLRSAGRVIDLDLNFGPVHMLVGLCEQELASPESIRRRLRQELWYLVTTYAINNQQEITRIAREIQEDMAVAGS